MKATSEYFSSKKEEANKEFRYFKGVDENCKAFNDKNMFDLEQVNSFSGFKGEDKLTNFSNAGGCNYSFSAMQGSMNMRNAAGGTNCQDGTHCQVGETCRNGECVPVRAERLTGGKNCQDGSHCNPFQLCRDGECVPNPRFPDGNNRIRGGASKRANRRMSSNPTSKSTSRRRSSDRIAVKPVMAQGRKSNFAAATRVFPEGQGNYFNGAASSKCGLDR